MAEQPKVPAHRIEDWGQGPRLFASKILSSRVDGGTVTLTLAVEEYRAEKLTAPPDDNNIIFAVVGYVTLTKSAANDLVNTINSLTAGSIALKAEKPFSGAN